MGQIPYTIPLCLPTSVSNFLWCRYLILTINSFLCICLPTFTYYFYLLTMNSFLCKIQIDTFTFLILLLFLRRFLLSLNIIIIMVMSMTLLGPPGGRYFRLGTAKRVEHLHLATSVHNTYQNAFICQHLCLIPTRISLSAHICV